MELNIYIRLNKWTYDALRTLNENMRALLNFDLRCIHDRQISIKSDMLCVMTI